jgi:hypothetical protein
MDSPPQPWAGVMSGARVMFPLPQPLGSQKLVMHAALRAMQAGQHGLLESPTGTGKTLALLIATLAHQHRARAEAVMEKAADDLEREREALAAAARAAAKDLREGAAARAALAARAAGVSVKLEAGAGAGADSGAGVVKLEVGAGADAGACGAGAAVAAMPPLPSALPGVEAAEAEGPPRPLSPPPVPAPPRTLKSLRGPRIIYTSRTHSQLAQVARELQKCKYYTRGEGHELGAFTLSGLVDPISFIRGMKPNALPGAAPAAAAAVAAGEGVAVSGASVGASAGASAGARASAGAGARPLMDPTQVVPPYFQATTLASRTHYCVNPAANKWSRSLAALHEELEQLNLARRPRSEGGAWGSLVAPKAWQEAASKVEIPKDADVNEACICLTKREKGVRAVGEVRCPYYSDADKLAEALKSPALSTWDIEDATALGVGFVARTRPSARTHRRPRTASPLPPTRPFSQVEREGCRTALRCGRRRCFLLLVLVICAPNHRVHPRLPLLCVAGPLRGVLHRVSPIHVFAGPGHPRGCGREP